MGISEISTGRVALAVFGLCLLAYLPFLQLPLIADDYLQIALARQYGSWQGQQTLFADALYRCRATSLWITWGIDRLFGPHVLPLALVCLGLHFINCMLVFALGSWERVGRGVATAAALFFAVYEGHQEAVVWISAMPELLVFCFGTICFLAAMRWLRDGGGRWLAILSLAYALALLSKESAVVVPALVAVFAILDGVRFRRWGPLAAGMGIVAAIYGISIFVAKQSHLHFNDGTFSLSAPFLKTLAISICRLFWFWGLLAAIVGVVSKCASFKRVGAFASLWIVVTFLPYVFLTYMPRVPSRHTYWASAGLALVVGAALFKGLPRLTDRRVVLAVVATAIIAHNCSYLWFKKLGQYRERARSTEELIEFSRRTAGVVRVRCFPYGDDIAFYSLEIVHGRDRSQIEIDPRAAGDSFCFVPRED